jgi:hypothetical protein
MSTIDDTLGLRVSAATRPFALIAGGVIATAGLGIAIAQLLG